MQYSGGDLGFETVYYPKCANPKHVPEFSERLLILKAENQHAGYLVKNLLSRLLKPAHLCLIKRI
jgi:hypothetical protein